jgi:hypothetical protein
MHMKRYSLLLIPAILAIHLASCEKDADLDLPDGQGM